MVELVVEFRSEGTAYLQKAGLLHLGPSPYTETPDHPLIGRQVIFHGERRVIKYVEREYEVPLSIKIAVLEKDWHRAYAHGAIKRGDPVGLLFEDAGTHAPDVSMLGRATAGR
ncbi:hypothetical protein [Rhizobium sp.]